MLQFSLLVSLSLLTELPAQPLTPTPAPGPVADDVDYVKQVHPILERHCFECHADAKQKGGMRFDTRDGLFAEHDGFAPVVVGNPDESLLLEMILLPGDDPDAMPPKGDRLSESEVATLRSWITQGAPWVEVVQVVEPEPLALEPLSPEQEAARGKAMAELAESGYAVMPIAQDLHAVDFNGSLARERFTDQEALRLAPLAPSLVWLNLSGTAITDGSAATLANLTQLRRLNLSRTSVTDAAVAALAGLPELEVLNLYGTEVGDAALISITRLGKLRKLYLWQTKVSDAGAAALQAAMPNLVINRGVLPPEPEPEPEAGAALNTLCPLTGEAVVADQVSTFEGAPVAFCCPSCKARFDADPAAFADKVKALRQ